MTPLPGPRGVAALRAARSVLNDPMTTVASLADEYGRTFAMQAGPAAIVIVGDRELIKVVLTGPQDRYRWGPMFKMALGVFVGPTSMLVSDGEDHARRRSLVQPAFALRRLNAWRHVVLDEYDRMIDALPLDQPIDLAPVIRASVRRIVVRVLFGDELDADDVGERLAPAAEYINRPFAKQPPHPFPWGARQRARRSRQSFDDVLNEEIARRAHEATRERDDVLDVLLATEGLTRQELADQVVSLIGAGYDTTTATASWLILRSAGDAEVWSRLRTEADSVAVGDQRPWADAVVHESLRIHPAGAHAPRLAATSFDLGPYRIRRGSIIAWSPLLAGRDPNSWPDPLRFDPSRHLDANAPEYAWVPFGAGSRSCLGFGLARMNLTLLASRLAQR
ncbi:MAG: cytochrome P450, partial [Acidimicrobiia bacterium]|nr:cytochrome P450 [Acidimicrobiia bacterium]